MVVFDSMIILIILLILAILTTPFFEAWESKDVSYKNEDFDEEGKLVI